MSMNQEYNVVQMENISQSVQVPLKSFCLSKRAKIVVKKEKKALKNPTNGGSVKLPFLSGFN